MSAPKSSLRAACDNCYQAKVKCVPTPSGCQRCISFYSPCFHSPPGRPGRVPTARNLSFNPEASTTSTSSQSKENDEPRDLHPSLKGLTGNGDFPETATLDIPLNGWVSMDPPSINEALYGESHIAFPEFAMRSPLSTRTDRQFNDFGDDMKSCTCFESTLQALEKAQRTDLQLLSLDIALRHNKDALLTVCNSIKCSVSHDSTTRLLILILLRKSLKLYQILFHLRLSAKSVDTPEINPTSAPYSLHVDNPSLSTSPTSIGQSDYFNVLIHPHAEKRLRSPPQSTRLTLGSYQLDEADERSLKKQIFLLDIGKVPRLLERLDQRACHLDEADGLDLYNMMRSSLIAYFRVVMTDIHS
jgi:hypothetical protein